MSCVRVLGAIAASSALLLAILAFGSRSPGAADETNQCVACHESEQLPITLGHSFDEWRVSPHARAGVGCEKCHGGDPALADPTAAHRGVLPVANAESLVHPKRLEATCGSCHLPELAAYSATVHAKQVQERSHGATCMTCHGSMATSLPSPAEMSARCAACHDQPLPARAALLVLAQAKRQLHKTERLLEEVKTERPEWHPEAETRFRKLEQSYAGVQLQWHTFDMLATLKESKTLLKLVHILDEEARVRLASGK